MIFANLDFLDKLEKALPLVAPLRIVDIGAANLGEGDQAPYMPLVERGHAHVFAFEPNPAELEKLKSTDKVTYLPYAIADGKKHKLHVRSGAGLTSLLENNNRSPLIGKFERLMSVQESLPVQTKKLDNVKEIDHIDHLKIDVQGSELMAMEGGKKKLAKAMSIQTEVAFIQIYKDQPLFAEQDQFLRGLGFEFLNFSGMGSGGYHRFPNLGSRKQNRRDLRQIIDADAIYLRDFMTWEKMSLEDLTKLVYLNAFIHDSRFVVAQLLHILLEKGAIKDALITAFKEALDAEYKA